MRLSIWLFEDMVPRIALSTPAPYYSIAGYELICSDCNQSKVARADTRAVGSLMPQRLAGRPAALKAARKIGKWTQYHYFSSTCFRIPAVNALRSIRENSRERSDVGNGIPRPKIGGKRLRHNRYSYSSDRSHAHRSYD